MNIMSSIFVFRNISGMSEQYVSHDNHQFLRVTEVEKVGDDPLSGSYVLHQIKTLLEVLVNKSSYA